jgi:hypothetical protein
MLNAITILFEELKKNNMTCNKNIAFRVVSHSIGLPDID